MSVGQAEAGERVALEVDLDQHGTVVAHYERVVSWRHFDHGRCDVVERASVVELEAQRSFHEESGMRVLALLSANERLDVARPPHARWVDQALDTRVADGADIDPDWAE